MAINKLTPKLSLDGIWRGAYGENCGSPVRFADVADLPEIEAAVPGTMESDMEKAGVLPEIYRGENVLLTQDVENYHYCLSRTFDYEPGDTDDVLVFEGLDCFADIFIDGVKIGENNNMLVACEFPLNLTAGEHELFVHIRPACVEARKFQITPYLSAQCNNWDTLYVRKAPSMYGWDIMPRVVSCGIWKHVYIDKRPKKRITDVFAYTTGFDGSGAADVRLTYNTWIGSANVHKFRIRFTFRCGDSCHQFEDRMWHTGKTLRLRIPEAKKWWPRNYGSPDLYTITTELYENDVLCDTYVTKIGLRTVQLDRTSTTDENGSGEFRFLINGKPVFAMGTNWVPVDAIHSRDEERLPEILPMLNDLGCNIVRCWGGNVYENDLFYDFCDENGIMIWQDFTMACECCPQDQYFQNLMRDEAEKVVLRLRNHACIILWAGDNECDEAYGWAGGGRDPNTNVITRQVLSEVLFRLDSSRPFLPSSPYKDEFCISSGKRPSEDHLWGPRDYFKGNFYKNTICHFASETGYHGCPSPESLKKYIDEDHLWPCLGDKQWLVHAATMDGTVNHPYGYRIRLMWNQVETLFGKDNDATSDLENFALASQISQAEAKKYFIERFRLSKWRRTGIIWWNLIDGWPQISDAIVDYYLDKKLAYHYIKCSQQPLCMMFDEPVDGKLNLYAVNDTRDTVKLNYTVEDDEGNVILSASADVESDTSVPVASIPATDEKRYYIIRWQYGEMSGMNHYFANIRDIDFGYYKTLLRKLGF